MPLIGTSLNQKRAPLDLRAVAANAEIDWAALIEQVCPTHSAWFILSTCNRFELYLCGDGVEQSHLRALLQKAFPIADTPARNEHSVGHHMLEHFDYFAGESAAEHLCRVAAGLESKVFGESQILGQVTRAYEAHKAARRLSHELDAVLRAAIRIGKRVRHETNIGANAGSIGSLAIQTVEAQYRPISNATIAVVGLGEMGRLIARNVVARGAANVLLLNRTFESAQRLAAEIGAQAEPWDRLARVVAQADVVFCATAAQTPVITPAVLASGYNPGLEQDTPNGLIPHNRGHNNRRHSRGQNGVHSDAAAPATQKVLVDLAVPRDVDSAIAATPWVDVVDLDELQTDLDESLAHRHAALPQAEQIIQEEIITLRARMRELEHRPLIVDLRQKAEEIRRQELARTLRCIQDAQAGEREGEAELDPIIAQHVEHLTRALVNKLLHEPTNKIRELAGCEHSDVPDELVRELFGLPNHVSGQQYTTEADRSNVTPANDTCTGDMFTGDSRIGDSRTDASYTGLPHTDVSHPDATQTDLLRTDKDMARELDRHSVDTLS